jgi:Zn-dependent protease
LGQANKYELIKISPFLFILVESFIQLVFINTALAIFNLIPIPPLDGSRLLYPFLNKEQEKVFAQFERYGILIIFLLLYLNIIDPIFKVFFRMIINLIS